MPPPQGIICEICGKKFFKHSYAIHLKQCAKKREESTVQCEYCGHTITKDEYEDHVPTCKTQHRGRKAKKAGNKPKSAVSDSVKEKLARVERGESIVPQEKNLGEFDPFRRLDTIIQQEGAIQENAEDGRVQCEYCQRKFNSDRIAKHQLICMKLKGKKKQRKPLTSEHWRLKGTDFEEFQPVEQSVKPSKDQKKSRPPSTTQTTRSSSSRSSTTVSATTNTSTVANATVSSSSVSDKITVTSDTTKTESELNNTITAASTCTVPESSTINTTMTTDGTASADAVSSTGTLGIDEQKNTANASSYSSGGSAASSVTMEAVPTQTVAALEPTGQVTVTSTITHVTDSAAETVNASTSSVTGTVNVSTSSPNCSTIDSQAADSELIRSKEQIGASLPISSDTTETSDKTRSSDKTETSDTCSSSNTTSNMTDINVNSVENQNNMALSTESSSMSSTSTHVTSSQAMHHTTRSDSLPPTEQSIPTSQPTSTPTPNSQIQPNHESQSTMDTSQTHQQTNKQKSGHVFRIGDRVKTSSGHDGLILFKGPVWGLPKGIWYGLQLDEAVGKNDGDFKSVKYFECTPQHGVFVRKNTLTLIGPTEAELLEQKQKEEKEKEALYLAQLRARQHAANSKEVKSKPPGTARAAALQAKNDASKNAAATTETSTNVSAKRNAVSKPNTVSDSSTNTRRLGSKTSSDGQRTVTNKLASKSSVTTKPSQNNSSGDKANNTITPRKSAVNKLRSATTEERPAGSGIAAVRKLGSRPSSRQNNTAKTAADKPNAAAKSREPTKGGPLNTSAQSKSSGGATKSTVNPNKQVSTDAKVKSTKSTNDSAKRPQSDREKRAAFFERKFQAQRAAQ